MPEDKIYGRLFDLTEELANAEADLKYFDQQCESFDDKDLDKFANGYEGYIEAEARVLVLKGSIESVLWVLELKEEIALQNETV